MKGSIILDTGPLVALINRRETYHTWAKDAIKELASPFLTCEGAIAESCFLLRNVYGGEKAVLEFLERGTLKIPFQLSQQASAILDLMQSYQSVPMSLTDACLVRMCELHPGSSVLTLDSDFRIYRQHRYQTIALIIPENI